jgi:hypothetical protein
MNTMQIPSNPHHKIHFIRDESFSINLKEKEGPVLNGLILGRGTGFPAQALQFDQNAAC